MTAAVLFGLGAGLGLWLVLTWAIPPQAMLQSRFADSTGTIGVAVAVIENSWAIALARPLLPGLRALGLPGRRLARDLRTMGRGADTHLATKIMLACAGLLTPFLVQGVLAVLGGPLGFEVPLVLALVSAAAGFIAPDLEVRGKATRARAQFRAALSAFLDLVWITLAGGSGVEAALLAAADVGRDGAFAQLRRALDNASLTRTAPWTTLQRLGEDLDIAELAELAASISLAGTEGAKVRASLAAKAAALRTHLVADAEAEAQAATERMALPVTLLFLGFLGFIAYPAVTQVLNGL
ncbi:type II secretion system F family protein [Amycolatopsis sp. NPDC004625]|uniref:type II secretion system F family protein n=1 Tax=Amycolatopsis sp. NPDC004625 TaxID=3154670 RepID=UPI0033A4C87C